MPRLLVLGAALAGASQAAAQDSTAPDEEPRQPTRRLEIRGRLADAHSEGIEWTEGFRWDFLEAPVHSGPDVEGPAFAVALESFPFDVRSLFGGRGGLSIGCHLIGAELRGSRTLSVSGVLERFRLDVTQLGFVGSLGRRAVVPSGIFALEIALGGGYLYSSLDYEYRYNDPARPQMAFRLSGEERRGTLVWFASVGLGLDFGRGLRKRGRAGPSGPLPAFWIRVQGSYAEPFDVCLDGVWSPIGSYDPGFVTIGLDVSFWV
ncbi:MAG: hypothetical protein L0216_15590 [Planctomycetales bacterium]|nr:hypothetical protein [Planctomycetales bacterium]